jgi:hypothetical protein
MDQMSGKVLPAAASDPLGTTSGTSSTDVKSARPAEQADSIGEADLRLIIDETEAGECVYTIVDRRTGRIVSRLSREELLRLREKSNYTAGAVFNGKA